MATPAAPPVPPPAPARRHWRPPLGYFFWILMAIQVIFILWLIFGIKDANAGLQNCSGLSHTPTGDNPISAYDNCVAQNDANHAGTAIGAGLVIGLWVAVDIILGVCYAIYRLARHRRSAS